VAERTLAELRLDGVPVADYRDGTELDPVLSPRPYLHPVRTLAGTVVTDARPADHRWHLGVSVAVPDVDGWNFWGGPTYVRDEGYLWRDDHGRIVHTGFVDLEPDGFTEQLRWITPRGEVVLVERREVRARLLARGWELRIVTTLANAVDRPVRLGSPAANGRAGAGYGGLFWRLPPAQEPRVRSAAADGEHAVHGAVAPWLAWRDRRFTLAVAAVDEDTGADPWFVRVREYPGVGSQLAARDPLVLPAAATTTRGLRALLADGGLDDRAVADWARGAHRS
jgi:hypothetical protein